MKGFILMAVATLFVLGLGLTGCGATGGKVSAMAHSEKAGLVADALTVAVVPAVEVFLARHPEHAELVAQVANEAAQSWPDGKTVSISMVGDRIEEILANKTDLSATSRTAIMGILSSIRTGVRVVLKLRGYSMPETLTTDGAALMQQIADVANSALKPPDSAMTITCVGVNVVAIHAVEVALKKQPECARLLTSIATETASSWSPQSRLSIDHIFSRSHEVLAARTDIDCGTRTAVTEILTSIQIDIVKFLSNCPPTYKTYGAELMTAIANESKYYISLVAI